MKQLLSKLYLYDYMQLKPTVPLHLLKCELGITMAVPLWFLSPLSKTILPELKLYINTRVYIRSFLQTCNLWLQNRLVALLLSVRPRQFWVPKKKPAILLGPRFGSIPPFNRNITIKDPNEAKHTNSNELILVRGKVLLK